MSRERVDDLQGRLVAFVRAFGLHRGDETPCGAPIPVSEAHALTVLDEAGGGGPSCSPRRGPSWPATSPGGGPSGWRACWSGSPRVSGRPSSPPSTRSWRRLVRTERGPAAARAGVGVGRRAGGGGGAVEEEGVADRQQEVAERGEGVMPFDLEATTHRFEPTADGLVQTVVADDPSDAANVSLVREHLTDEAERFAAGDYDDPAAIHGWVEAQVMDHGTHADSGATEPTT